MSKQVSALVTFPKGITEKQVRCFLLDCLAAAKGGAQVSDEFGKVLWEGRAQVTTHEHDHGGVVIYQP